MGESGSGKSTTALAIMRLLDQRRSDVGGSIEFEGRELTAMGESEMTGIRGKEIGMIFQNPLDSLNPVYTAGRQVYEAIALDRVDKATAWRRVIGHFEDVRLSDPEQRVRSFPHELSGGMRQRVMIGMMISRKPQLLIADEPTTALDVTIQAQILEIIKRLRSEFGTAVLLITHNFGVVAEVADRVGVMYASRIVEIGSIYQVFENPKHPYTVLLMKSLPANTKAEGRLAVIPGSVPDLSETVAGCRFHGRCPYAADICRVEEPAAVGVGPGHQVACHLAGGGE